MPIFAEFFLVPLEPGAGGVGNLRYQYRVPILTKFGFWRKIYFVRTLSRCRPCYQVLTRMTCQVDFSIRPVSATVVLPWMSCPDCHVIWLSCHGCPSRLPCPSYRFLAVLTQLSPSCPVLTVTFWSSCPTVCVLSWLSSAGCPILAVLHVVLSWLSSAVIIWLKN
jgi:hypothetical protein